MSSDTPTPDTLERLEKAVERLIWNYEAYAPVQQQVIVKAEVRELLALLRAAPAQDGERKAVSDRPDSVLESVREVERVIDKHRAPPSTPTLGDA